MNIERFFLLILLLLLHGPWVMAQNKVSLRGYVKDTGGIPLPLANVYSRESGSESIMAFASTDNEGYFFFQTPRTDTLIIVASLLGYETHSLSFVIYDSIPEFVEFKLSSKALVLKEALVRASGKIIEKSDTVTFMASRFRDSTELNLEDLLKKLPGIAIDESSGVISIRGKPIKKILIDGDDLTGRNYQLMSRNMGAEVVDKIQIIDKFDENKLLKGVRRSEDKVLNITLNEGSKGLFFGNISGAIGNDQRTNNSLNLFSFFNRFRTLTFGNFNNTGRQSDVEMIVGNLFSANADGPRLNTLLRAENEELIRIGHASIGALGSQSVRFNRSAMVSSHFAVRPLEKLSVKGNFSLAGDRQKSYVNNEWKYQLADSLFVLSEQNEWERRPFVWQGRVDALADITTRSSLRYQLQIKSATVNNDLLTDANQNQIDNSLSNQSFVWQNEFDYTVKLTDNRAFQVNVVYHKNDKTQELNTHQTQSRLLYPASHQPFVNLSQFVNNPMIFWSASGQFLLSGSQHQTAIHAGITQKRDKLLSSLQLKGGANEPITLTAAFENNGDFIQTNTYTGLNFSRKWQQTEWFADFSGGFYNLQHTDSLFALTKSGWYALPALGFKEEKDNRAFFGAYSFTFGLPQIADVTRGYIVKDYRQVERGAALFIPANSHTVILNYLWGQFADDVLFHANLVGTTTARGYRKDWQINDYFDFASRVENHSQNANVSFSAGLELFSPHLNNRFKLRPKMSWTSFQNTLNDSDLRKVNGIVSAVELSARSGFLQWFNYHTGISLGRSDYYSKFNGKKSTVNDYSIGTFLDLYFHFSGGFSATLESEMYYFEQSSATPQHYTFINAILSHKFWKNRLSLNLHARNLSNTRAFVNSYTSDLSTNINKVRLLPRYILLEANYRF